MRRTPATLSIQRRAERRPRSRPPRERAVAGEAAEHGEHERPDRATERGDRVRDPEDEHRPGGPVAAAPLQLGRGEGQLAAEEEGDADADEQEADDDAQVADDVGDALAAGPDDEAEHREHS
jgi:hypothetical protein